MFPKVLNKEETHAFIECVLLNDHANIKKIEGALGEANTWQSYLHIVTYFVAMVLERKKKDGQNVEEIITRLHSLTDKMAINICELDSDFIAFMLRHISPENDDIETAIVDLHQRWIDHDYSRDLRL